MQDQSRSPHGPSTPASRATLGQIFTAFLSISARSWGGGSGTTYVMHRELTRRGWTTSEQFAADFGISRIIPGINLIAIAVMTGYRHQGFLGALVANLGLMLPASIITLILTVGFSWVTAHPLGEAAVKGAVPVTAALTFALAVENGSAVMPWREKRVAVAMAVFALVAFLLVVAFHVPTAFMIIGGAIVGAFCFRPPTAAKPA